MREALLNVSLDAFLCISIGLSLIFAFIDKYRESPTSEGHTFSVWMIIIGVVLIVFSIIMWILYLIKIIRGN